MLLKEHKDVVHILWSVTGVNLEFVGSALDTQESEFNFIEKSCFKILHAAVLSMLWHARRELFLCLHI